MVKKRMEVQLGSTQISNIKLLVKCMYSTICHVLSTLEFYKEKSLYCSKVQFKVTSPNCLIWGSLLTSLNGYLEKSGEGKQEGWAKAQDGWPPTPHCTSWLKGQETEISTAGTDCKVLMPFPLPFFTFLPCWHDWSCQSVLIDFSKAFNTSDLQLTCSGSLIFFICDLNLFSYLMTLVIVFFLLYIFWVEFPRKVSWVLQCLKSSSMMLLQLSRLNWLFM